MDKYESEIYQGNYPQASVDHHEDHYKNMKKNEEAEYNQWELEQQQKDELGVKNELWRYNNRQDG